MTPGEELQQAREDLYKFLIGLPDNEQVDVLDSLDSETREWVIHHMGVHEESKKVNDSTVIKHATKINHDTASRVIKENSWSLAANIKGTFDYGSRGMGGNPAAYGVDANGVSLGTSVNGLSAAVWDGMSVSPVFRKVIDCIETGGKASYFIAGHISSAYGRYQFMPKTARAIAKQIGIPVDKWREPINQDKCFQRFSDNNKRAILNKGLEANVWTMWIAHNLGTGALNFMTGKTDKPYSGALRGINNQLGNQSSNDVLVARSNYQKKFKSKIKSCIGNASVTKTTQADMSPGSVSGGVSSAGGGGGASATSGNGSNYSGGSIELRDWKGEEASNIIMEDVITLHGSAATGGWKGLKNEFKTRLLMAAYAYKEVTSKKLPIGSAFRNKAHQANLYAKTSKPGRNVAAPGRSMHNFGLAVDLGTGQPSSGSRAGDVLHANGILKKYKLYRPMDWEKWHIEPIETIGSRGAKGSQVVLNNASIASPTATSSYSGTYDGGVSKAYGDKKTKEIAEQTAKIQENIDATSTNTTISNTEKTDREFVSLANLIELG